MNIAAVGGVPRVDSRRVHFTLHCGSGSSSCDNMNDTTESQWCNNPSPTGCNPALDEIFSAKLRVKEIRAFAEQVDSDPVNPKRVAFCAAFIAGAGTTIALSDCDSSARTQTNDCKASPRDSLNFSPADTWKITFSDQASGGTPSRCASDPNRTDVWVEFKLEIRP
jgi:hypothetical protein